MASSGQDFDALELGVFAPVLKPTSSLSAGEVGYLATGLKNVREVQVGDTVTTATRPVKSTTTVSLQRR